MGETTKIQWTDHTFNPWWGCAKVSPGCAHCYAEAQAARFEKDRGLWGVDARRRVTGLANWREPERWDRAAALLELRRRVFCGSMCDVFEDRVDLDEHRVRLFDLIRRTPHLDWLLLTKRPGAVRGVLERIRWGWPFDVPGAEQWLSLWCEHGRPPLNVLIGATVEDQQRAEERIPALVDVPAHRHFLSCEPLLSPLDLRFATFNGADSFGVMPGIDWIIVGGESGRHARPCAVEWIEDVVEQCRSARVPCFVKQLGAAAGLRDPKGGDLDEWPEHLRVREIPAATP